MQIHDRYIEKNGVPYRGIVTAKIGDNINTLLNHGYKVYVPKGMCIDMTTNSIIETKLDCVMYYKCECCKNCHYASNIDNVSEGSEQRYCTIKAMRVSCLYLCEKFKSNQTEIKLKQEDTPETSRWFKTGYLEQLIALTKVTCDGELISKSYRDQLIKAGYVYKANGFNCITAEGIQVLIALGILQP